jgi:hypothetical protein
MGVHFLPLGADLRLTPLAGYITQRLELTQTDGVQVVPDTGPYPGLDSSTTTHWHGPLVGLDVVWRMAPAWTITASGRYGWMDFSGVTDWNLRTDLEHPVSLEQQGDARMARVGVALGWAVDARWSCHLRGDYEYWHTTSGTDRVRVVGGTDDDASLREFQIKALTITLGTGWRF